MDKKFQSSESLATGITKSASKQTYYTIRFFADRDRAADAYKAYGYFRWVDDVIDAEVGSSAERIAFANRQNLYWSFAIAARSCRVFVQKNGC